MFLDKKAYFFLKKCKNYADFVLTLSELVVPSDAACYDNSYLTMFERIAYHSPEVTFAKCCKYALFLYKNTFFPKKICVFAFFVVPLQRKQ